MAITKWITYQKERFPVIKYAILVSAFTVSGLALSYLLTGSNFALRPQMFVVAFTVTFLTFFQLRVADEHKDFDFDAKHHPERPVQRGLVTLKGLRRLAIAAGFIQFFAVMSLRVSLLVPLGLAWFYMWLMTNEFFAGDWLRKRPILYMITHMSILFFTDLFITSCHFMVWGLKPPMALVFFLGTSFFLGTVIEVGRKIRSPQEETTARDTYSMLWGRETAVKVWISAIGMSAIFAIITASQIHFEAVALTVLSLMLALCAFCGKKFLLKSTPSTSKSLDTLSGIWTLTTYLIIGLVPLLISTI
ncbi:MAG: UbiA family prenyltransferase [Candidatus Obscuribacterales bacterium]|nr:UbiA family prenyltransferase [Candidatus Obscuribacterales bacterium]